MYMHAGISYIYTLYVRTYVYMMYVNTYINLSSHTN